MSLFGIAAGALRAAADIAERFEHSGGGDHGPACEVSKQWMASGPDSRIVPMRLPDEVIAHMVGENGWEFPSKSLHLRDYGDGTYYFIFERADEVDHLSNRVVQRMVATALDLAQALDTTNCDLSETAVDALAAFKQASRQRLRADV